MHTRFASYGFSLVEIIVATAIFVGAAVSFVASFQVFTDLTRHTADRTQAAILLEEGSEAVQLLRDEGWSAYIAPLSLGTAYSLYWNGSAYAATTTPIVIDGAYLRTITFGSVRRDSSDDISSSGAIDANTRTVTITISRASDGEELLSAEGLVHNSYDDD
jgi:prepilin-type N-terminal cleavage/methylation domain-containing protein